MGLGGGGRGNGSRKVIISCELNPSLGIVSEQLLSGRFNLLSIFTLGIA